MAKSQNSLPGEVWKPVPLHGLSHLYEVSNMGRVRSTGNHAKGSWSKTVRVLSPEHYRKGYRRAELYDGKGGRRKAFVHRLVLMAFVGPCPEGMQCRHLNGEPSDNRLDNLAWGTPITNAADSIAHGTRGAGISRQDRRDARAMVLRAYRAVAQKYGVSMAFARAMGRLR